MVADELKHSTVFHKPNLHVWDRGELCFFLDGESPNWIATDERGSRILEWVDGKSSFGDIIQRYAQSYQMDPAKSWLHCHTFLRDALRTGIISLLPIERAEYLGRSHYLKPERLKEFWIHLTQTCNLVCTHCLVSSGPHGGEGLGKDFYLRAIDESGDLGVERYYFTGGEPFVRPDIFELIRAVVEGKKKELIILTNATLFNGERLKQLSQMDRGRLKFQVSLDGTTAETNDAIRGAGVFKKTSEGLRALVELGFETSLTAVVTKENLNELEGLPKLAKSLGAKSIHLMWPHKRGRILQSSDPVFPNTQELLNLCLEIKRNANELGVLFDNLESLKLRANGPPQLKYDLGMMGWESLCLYMDGQLYPSAAMSGHAGLSLGHLNGKTVRQLWLGSDLASQIRGLSVVRKESAGEDFFRYITGGGDMEHSYFFSANGNGGSFVGGDPYYFLQVELIKEIMWDLASAKRESANTKSGFSAPVVVHAMGEGAVACSEDAQDWIVSGHLPVVRLLHSNCVLSFSVEKSYKAVQAFYGKAAEKPQAELCCPVKYDDSEIGHIPQEVLDRFYGCGSPISMAQVQASETILDLGSGAGIDCFIAAKKVGVRGKVIGIDMTNQMLEVANRSKEIVAKKLGYDVVEFRTGYLEKIPAGDRSVDLVTSNCVINLSPNKQKVFAEIWRILKDAGRFVVADIVSDRFVPLSLQAHQGLWGECISGSLSESEFISQLEKSGFYGISLLKKTFWKEVEGIRFYSITVRGFKFEKRAGCRFIGQKAVYLGPYKAAMDEEGHLFPRGETVEVCTDTAAKLSSQPYAGQFSVTQPNGISSFKIQNSLTIGSNESECCKEKESGCC